MHIVARPRIHISLADMGYASHRSFGGIGFLIDHSPTVIQFEPSDTVEVTGIEALDDSTKTDISEIISRLKSLRTDAGFRANLRSSPRQHIGLGSKTSLALSLIAGANAFSRLGLTIAEMQRLSGRGAASGVGIHAFFYGGVIWDGGHKSAVVGPLFPSGSRRATSLPPLMMRMSFPADWRVMLLLSDERSMSGQDEIKFFSENTPVQRAHALETMALLYHGVMPAFVLKDYFGLASALRDLHGIGFKMRELHRLSPRTVSCINALFEHGLAAGLSSVGPLLYAIVPNSDPNAMACVRSVCTDMNVQIIGTADGWNAGYELRSGVWS